MEVRTRSVHLDAGSPFPTETPAPTAHRQSHAMLSQCTPSGTGTAIDATHMHTLAVEAEVGSITRVVV